MKLLFDKTTRRMTGSIEGSLKGIPSNLIALTATMPAEPETAYLNADNVTVSTRVLTAVEQAARSVDGVVAPPPIPVVITTVPGVESGYSDSDNNYTILEGVEYLATGTCAIPAQSFRVPFVRTDTGRKVYMRAVVAAEGAFVLYLNLPTKGEWYTDTDQLNSELPQPLFIIDKQVFKVM